MTTPALTPEELERIRQLVERHAPDLAAKHNAITGHHTDFVMARPRRGVKPALPSPWALAHVWTLHRRFGKPKAPPIAVCRRMLHADFEHGYLVETPGGTMSIDAEELAETGRSRGYGTHRWDGGGGRPQGPAGLWGCDLALDVYDHPPTLRERRAWAARRSREQVLVRRPPATVWVQFEGTTSAIQCRAERAIDVTSGDIERKDLSVELPGYVPPVPGQFYEHRLTVDLYELAVAGEVPVHGPDGAERVFLRKKRSTVART